MVNARFAKPLDNELILGLAGRMPLVIVEENALVGGFGGSVAELLSDSGMTHVKVERLGLPDNFIEHGTQEMLRSMFNLDCDGIVRKIENSFPELIIASSTR